MHLQTHILASFYIRTAQIYPIFTNNIAFFFLIRYTLCFNLSLIIFYDFFNYYLNKCGGISKLELFSNSITTSHTLLLINCKIDVHNL